MPPTKTNICLTPVDSPAKVDMFKTPKNTSPSEISLGRNKVALKPGRSLMNWIQLTHSGADLAQNCGKIRPVSPEELSKHNKKHDAWICLQGKVYNVTPYFEYHPGGEDELVKGIGRDATELFNQIHRWVNADSMLQKCFIGPLKASGAWLHSLQDLHLLNEALNKKTTYEWIQTENMIHITFLNLPCTIKQRHITIDLIDRHLTLSIRLKNKNYKFNMDLERPVTKKYSVFVINKNCQARITLAKETAETWVDLGKPLPGNDSIKELKEEELNYRDCEIIEKINVNYNTRLFTLRLLIGTKLSVPVGHHVCLKSNINDIEILRYYTPILPSFNSNKLPENQLHLMIKIYENGILTPTLDSLNVGEHVLISDYLGDFDKSKLKKYSNIVLLAAGTGFTPMIKLIQYCIAVCSNVKKIILVFFNRTKNDILWEQNLEDLQEKVEKFNVFHILSCPDESWEGLTGHLASKLLQDLIPDDLETNDVFFPVCGPISFNKCAITCLEELKYQKDNIHEFC